VPLYEYQCQKCKHKFEKIQKFSDRPLKKCPECGGPLEKVLHAAGLNFKGAGWYVTDYAGKSGDSGSSPSEKDSSASKAPEKPKADAKNDSKSESKSESKSDSKSESPKSESKKPAQRGRSRR
jgi:putative FmdB family regulatory protein